MLRTSGTKVLPQLQNVSCKDDYSPSLFLQYEGHLAGCLRLDETRAGLLTTWSTLDGLVPILGNRQSLELDIGSEASAPVLSLDIV